MCHGAWCWEYWIDWFADRGRSVTALSLCGHAGSDGREELHGFGLADYRDDVLATARRFGRPVVLVGHSMGGAVTQMAAAAEPALFAGVDLFATLLPDGIRRLELVGEMFRIRSMRSAKRLMRGETLRGDEVRRLSFFDNRITRDQAARMPRCSSLNRLLPNS